MGKITVARIILLDLNYPFTTVRITQDVVQHTPGVRIPPG